MREYPSVVITQEMLDAANSLTSKVNVNRTKTSEADSLVGIIGEYAFVQWLDGDWRKSETGDTKGKVDYKGVIEIKTSLYPFDEGLNLLVREDYAQKRHPPFYVQVIIDVRFNGMKTIPVNTKAIISGFATSQEVENADLKHFGSKLNDGNGGYKCKYIQIRNLHPMSEFKEAYLNLNNQSAP